MEEVGTRSLMSWDERRKGFEANEARRGGGTIGGGGLGSVGLERKKAEQGGRGGKERRKIIENGERERWGKEGGNDGLKDGE